MLCLFNSITGRDSHSTSFEYWILYRELSTRYIVLIYVSRQHFLCLIQVNLPLSMNYNALLFGYKSQELVMLHRAFFWYQNSCCVHSIRLIWTVKVHNCRFSRESVSLETCTWLCYLLSAFPLWSRLLVYHSNSFSQLFTTLPGPDFQRVSVCISMDIKFAISVKLFPEYQYTLFYYFDWPNNHFPKTTCTVVLTVYSV